jgi:rod shape-determining protein MreD
MDLIGSGFLDLDLLTIMIAYLFLYYGQTAVAIFAFGQGMIFDLYSGGLQGLFTFLYLIVYGGIYLGYRFFDLHRPKGQVIIVALAVLFKRLMFFIMLAVFSRGTGFSKEYLWTSMILAIGTGLIAPILFYVFDFLRTDSSEDTLSAPTELP